MDKILMIKEVRNQTKCGLREAKEIVESFQNGEGIPEHEKLMALVAEKVKDRVPRSQEYRKFILSALQQMRYRIDDLDEYLSDEWDDFRGARQTLNEILGKADHLSRLIGTLEDAIYEEKSKGS